MSTAEQLASTVSLYERLGGTPGIQTLVEDVFAAHCENPILNKRFLPYAADVEKKAVALNHLCMFLEAGTGGPGVYEGRPMAEAHRGMNISGEEYLAAVDDIMAALRKHNASEETQTEMLNTLYAIKDDIMRQ